MAETAKSLPCNTRCPPSILRFRDGLSDQKPARRGLFAPKPRATATAIHIPLNNAGRVMRIAMRGSSQESTGQRRRPAKLSDPTSSERKIPKIPTAANLLRRRLGFWLTARRPGGYGGQGSPPARPNRYRQGYRIRYPVSGFTSQLWTSDKPASTPNFLDILKDIGENVAFYTECDSFGRGPQSDIKKRSQNKCRFCC